MIQDVEIFLRSAELIDLLVDTYGNDFSEFGGEEVSQFVVDQVIVQKEVPENLIDVVNVVSCKTTGDGVDILDTAHTVVQYNGYYYDYTAVEFSNSFDGLITNSSIPVVQPVIMSENQISSKLSTVKGYVMLGY